MSRQRAWPILALVLLSCPAAERGGEADAPVESGKVRRAILSALGEPDVWKRTSSLVDLLSRLPADAVGEVRELLDDRSRDLGALESLLLVSFWAEHDPPGASEWAIAQSPPSYRVGAIAASVTTWARSAPQDVVERLGLAGASARDASVTTALIRGWFASGDAGLEQYVRDLGPGIARQRALAILARERIARDGSRPTIRWAEETAKAQSDSFALDLVRQVGAELALADPPAGVAFCDTHCEGPHGDALRQLVATRWAVRDGAAALAWLEDSVDADAKQRERALRAAFGVYLRRDRARALAWVESLDDEQRAEVWRQPAIAAYVAAIASDRPEDAIAWTMQLRDPAEREQMLVSVARRWRDQDPDAAEAWLARSPLSEAARQRARTRPDLPAPRLEPGRPPAADSRR
jgi:hypothetical protein